MDTTELRETWLRLKPEVERVAKEAKTLSSVAKRLVSDEGYEALKKVQKDIASVESLTLRADGLMDSVSDALVPVRTWLEEEWTRRATLFAEELHRFFADREVELTGTPPVMEAGPVAIEFDTRQDQARVLYAGEPVRERIPLAPHRIFREWQTACQTLERNLTSPDELFDAVVTAYEQVCRLKDIKMGARVRLPDLHFQLFVNRQTVQVKQDPRKSRLKEYPRYQFVYDLAHLMASTGGLARGGRTLELHVAARSAAESRSASIHMPDGRGGWTYYSDLQVEGAGEGR
jgi:hypothetical protein